MRDRNRTLLIVAILALVFAPGWAIAGPKTTFLEKSWTAGDVQKGTVIEHEFVIKNEGDVVVRVTEVHASCGCSVVDYPPQVEPGAEQKIKFQIKTETLSTGPQSKTITVATDDPEAARTVLQIKLNVVTALEILPRDVIYMNTPLGRAKEEKVLVRPHREGLKVLSVSSSNPVFKVSLSPVKAAAAKREGVVRSLLMEQVGDYWVAVELAAGAPAGIHRGEIKLKTTDAAMSEAMIKVTGMVKEQPKDPKAAANSGD